LNKDDIQQAAVSTGAASLNYNPAEDFTSGFPSDFYREASR